jgi:hypothetical protein
MMRFFAFKGRIKMTLVSDSAIKGYQEDLLERKDFAYNIADIVAKRTENDAFHYWTNGCMGEWEKFSFKFNRRTVSEMP